MDKRNIWIDSEVADMLSIIREKEEILDNTIKRNKNVFEDVARAMGEKGYRRTGDQVKAKFKNLKCDFYKAKRNNNTSGAQRQTCHYFDILNELFEKRPALTSKEADTPAEANHYFDFATEGAVSFQEPVEDIWLESNSNSNFVSQSPAASQSNANSPLQPRSTAHSTLKKTKKGTYEKVVESFTQEWKATQEEMLKASKEEEKQFLGDIHEMLNKKRVETAKLLEADRQENVKMLNAVMSKMQSNVQPGPLGQIEVEKYPKDKQPRNINIETDKRKKSSLKEIVELSLNREARVKEDYYTKKLRLMERDVIAKESIASSLRTLAESRSVLF